MGIQFCCGSLLKVTRDNINTYCSNLDIIDGTSKPKGEKQDRWCHLLIVAHGPSGVTKCV